MEAEISNLKKELQWHYSYMFYISNFYNIIDGEACAHADGDEEYLEALSNKIVFNNIMQSINHLEEYQKKQLAMILISKTLNAQSNLETFKIIAKDE